MANALDCSQSRLLQPASQPVSSACITAGRETAHTATNKCRQAGIKCTDAHSIKAAGVDHQHQRGTGTHPTCDRWTQRGPPLAGHQGPAAPYVDMCTDALMWRPRVPYWWSPFVRAYRAAAGACCHTKPHHNPQARESHDE